MPRTTTLSRDKSSGSWRARKQIPPTIRTAYAATFGRSHEEKFSKPATLSEREARIAFADWLANVEARIAIVSAQLKDDGVDLTHAQAHALAGRWYRWKAALHHDDPGSPQRWADEIRGLTAGIRDMVPEADGGRLRGGPSDGHASTASFERFEDLLDRLKTSQAQVLNRVAEAAWAAEFLAQERVFLSAAGRRRFLCALVYELVAVNALLARRSLGDYSPDPRPARFPAWKPPAPTSGDVMSPMGLYKAWCTANEARTSNSTRARWITVFRDLERFWKGRDVRAFTEEDALRWRDELRAGGDKPEGRTDKTVNFQYIAAAKAVFAWAARPKTNDGGEILPVSPFANFRFGQSAGSKKKTTKLRERSFRLEEMGIILPKAQSVHVTAGSPTLDRAKRWAPWLLAYTGARPGEITQLRREDLRKVQGRWALRLTPEAGTIKDREARIVPIHEHLVAQGLIDFIEAQQDGPLFYRPEALRRKGKDDPSNPRRWPHEKVVQLMAAWVREIGVTDPNIKPNHAWRHTFKTRALVAGIDSVVADFICGHAAKTVGDSYYALEGDAGWPALTRAIDAFPRYAF